jgi:hypothetical protein
MPCRPQGVVLFDGLSRCVVVVQGAPVTEIVNLFSSRPPLLLVSNLSGPRGLPFSRSA